MVLEGERDELVERRRVERAAPAARGRGSRSSSPARTPIAARVRPARRARRGRRARRRPPPRAATPLGRLLRVGAQRGGGRRRGEQPRAVVPDRDLDGRARSPSACAPSSARPWRRAASSRARRCAVAAAGARRLRRASASARGECRSSRRGVDRGLEGGARRRRRGRRRRCARAASRARGGARTSSTSIRAASSIGKPPTPVPNATSARLRAPSSLGAAQRGGRGAADDVGRRRAAELHRGGVDDPAAGHRAARRLDRLAEADRGGRCATPRRSPGRRRARSRPPRRRRAAAPCWPRWRSRRPPGR